jgi:hypothetical protein
MGHISWGMGYGDSGRAIRVCAIGEKSMVLHSFWEQRITRINANFEGFCLWVARFEVVRLVSETKHLR